MASPIDELLNLPGPVGDAARNADNTVPLPGEMPADTETRIAKQSALQAQVDSTASRMRDQSIVQANRIRATDFDQRKVPHYTDDTGSVVPVVDQTGAALTQLDKTHGIAYDAQGNPKKIIYGETGAPKLADPFEGVPTTTDDNGNQYQAVPGLPWKYLGNDPAVPARKFKGKDLAQRGVPVYTDPATGQPQAVTDSTGTPLNNFDKPHNVAYDSQGNPVQLKWGASGPPAVEDAFAGVPVTTDEKTGDKYRIRTGLPWQYAGEDADIKNRLLEEEKNKATKEAASASGRKLTLDERQITRDKVEYDHRKKALVAEVPSLAVHDGEDFDSLSKAIDATFDKKYAADEANDKPMFGGGKYTPAAEALRAKITADKAHAHQMLSDLDALNQHIVARQQHVDDTQAQLDALESQRVDAALAKAKAAGVSVPGMGGTTPAPAAAPAPATTAATPAPPPAPVTSGQELGHAADGLATAPQPTAATTSQELDHSTQEPAPDINAQEAQHAKTSAPPATVSADDIAAAGKQIIDRAVGVGSLAWANDFMDRSTRQDIKEATDTARNIEDVTTGPGSRIWAQNLMDDTIREGVKNGEILKERSGGVGSLAWANNVMDKKAFDDSMEQLRLLRPEMRDYDETDELMGRSPNAKVYNLGLAKGLGVLITNATSSASATVAQILRSPLGKWLNATGTLGFSTMEEVLSGHKIGSQAEAGSKALDKIAGVITDPAFSDTGEAKAGRFIGGTAPWVAQGVVAPEATIPLLFSSGYQGQLEAAKAHGADDATAMKAGLIGGSINTVLGIPFKSAGKTVASFFGSASEKVVQSAFESAYEKEGASGVLKLLTAWKEAFEKGAAPGIVPKGGAGAADALRDAVFQKAAAKGLENVIAELNRSFASRVGAVALNAARDAALFAGVTAGQNITAKELYDPERNIGEGVRESAIGGGVFGSLFGTLHQVRAGMRAEATRAAMRASDEAVAARAAKAAKGRAVPPEEGGAAGTPEPPPPGGPSSPSSPQKEGGTGGPGSSGEPPAPSSPSGGPSPKGGAPASPTGGGAPASPAPPPSPVQSPSSGSGPTPPAATGGGAGTPPAGPQPPPSTGGGAGGGTQGGGANVSSPDDNTVDNGAHGAATSPTNDLTASPSQLEANNVKVGRMPIGGMDISITHPEGSMRSKIDVERLDQVADAFGKNGTTEGRSIATEIADAKRIIGQGEPEAGFDKLRNIQNNTYAQYPAMSDVIGEILDKSWARKMQAHYGYIRETKSGDGEHLDVFVKPGTPKDYSGPVYVVNSHVEPNGRVDHKAIIGAASAAEAKQIHDSHYPPALHAPAESIAEYPSVESFKKWAHNAERRGPAPGAKITPPVDTKAKAKQDAKNKAAADKLRDQIAELQAEIDFNSEEGDPEQANPGLERQATKLRADLAKLTNETEANPEEVPEANGPQDKGGTPPAPKPGKTQPGGGGSPPQRPEQPAAKKWDKPDVAKQHAAATLEQYRERFEQLGITARPHKSGEESIESGIATDPDSFEVIHDAAQQGRLMGILEKAGGDAEKWQEHTVNEEHEHGLDIVVSGHEFGKWHRAIMTREGKDALPPLVRTGLELCYPDTSDPVKLGVELIRMLAQVQTRGSITEDFIPGRPTQEFINALNKWDLPEDIAKHLLAMARIREDALGNLSWRVDASDDGGKSFASNSMRYATKEAAEAAGRDLQGRWMAMTDYKVRASGDPVNVKEAEAEAPPAEAPPPVTAPAVKPGEVRKNLQLARDVAAALAQGPLDRRALTAMAKDSGLSQKEVDEAAELGVVLAARNIVTHAPPALAFEALVNLYESQPNLTAKTSTSKVNQAYSTPVPLAWATGMRIGMGDANVAADDTAGNGALTLAANPKNTVVNEIDPTRRAQLEQMGFKKVTDFDATQETSQADRKNLNPPFGTQLEGGSKKSWPLYTSDTGVEVDTPNIDMAIVAKSLSGLTKDGKASIIMGGKPGTPAEREAGYSVRETQLPFWHWLYKNFKVTDHFTVSGDLYAKQGAKWPIDVIIIEGKGEESSLPRPWMKAPPVLETWEQVGERLLANEQSGSIQQAGGASGKPPLRQPRVSGPGGSQGSGSGLGNAKPGKPKPVKLPEQDAGGGKPPAVAPKPDGPGGRGNTPPAGGGKPGGSVQPPEPGSSRQLTPKEQAAKDAMGDLFGASSPLRRGRNAELEEANRALKAKEIDRAEYDRRVEALKPVAPLTKLPEAPTDEQMKDALTSEKAPLVGAARDLSAGTPVGLRIDIPAFKKSGKYVVTIHEQASAGKVGKRIGYDSVATVENPRFFVTSQDLSQKIATGEVAKAPLATIEGNYVKGQDVPADVLKDTQVSYDPERHGYFYDRVSGRPVVGGSRATLVGNTAFVKDAVFGENKNFLYASAPGELPNYETPIPAEKRVAAINAFMDLASEADTPEKFAEALKSMGPKAHLFSQPLWYIAKSGGAQGPDRPDWATIYGHNKPKEPEKTKEPEHKLKTEEDADNPFQTEYTPRSKSPLLNAILVPVNLRDEINRAMDDLEARRGPADDFVASQARWLPGGVKELHEVLDGGQVDALALAIDKIMNGTALITGDQTGMGKGRVAAGVQTWAQQEGYTPIFITAGNALYHPMMEDFKDIHADHMVPFITNDNMKLKNSEQQVVFQGEKGAKLKEQLQGIIDRGRLPEGTNVLFTTYDQIKSDVQAGLPTEQPRLKRARQNNRIPRPDGLRTQAMRTLAPNAVFVMDEVHMAAGTSDTNFRLMQMLMGWNHMNNALSATGEEKPVGAYYSSATFAKRPDNMPIYAVTDLGKAVTDPRKLADIFQGGGVAIQQVVSAMLARGGQYIRREMSYSGITFTNHLIGEAATKENPQPEQYRQADAFTAPLRDIIDFSDHLQEIVAAINAELMKEGEMIDGEIVAEQLQSVEFSSLVHNMVGQYLLAVKAKATAEEAVRHLAEGKKPVITVENTLAGPYEETLARGFKPNFQGLLYRYLDKALDVTRKMPDGSKRDETIDLNQYIGHPNPRVRMLAERLRDEYETHKETVGAADVADLHISPIDTIKEEIERAGYTAGEITGRQMGVKTDGKTYKRPAVDRTASGKNEILSKFNNAGKNGERGFDALVLNRSGSTGISAHNAPKFHDQRDRVMLIAQPNADISQMMQMYGRINRKGQLTLPQYFHLLSQIAAERRLASVLARKLKGLKANTTSNVQGSEMTESADLFNNYGDIASYVTLEAHPEIVEQLRISLGGVLPSRFSTDGEDTIPAGGAFFANVSGETNILFAKWQDVFYKEAEAEWNSIVQQANEMGTNELVVDAMDLKARTMDSEVLAPEVGNTEFESAAMLETVETKAGRPPHTLEEVKKMLSEESPKAREQQEAWRQAFTEARGARMADLEQHNAHRETWPQIQQQTESRLNRDRGIIEDAFGMVGSGITVDMEGNIATGIVTGAKADLDNPLLPSRQKIVVQINTSKRTISVPATQARRLLIQTSLQQAEEDYERTINRSTRRYIATGNLIAGMEALQNQHAKGKIITFTTEDGTVRNGILLPLDYSPGAAMVKIKDANHLANALANGIEVRTPSGLSIRSVGTPGFYEVRVPAARNRGGRYWREDAFNALMQGGQMRQQASEMIGSIARERLPAFVDFVNKTAGEKLQYTEPPRQGPGRVGASNPLKSIQKAMTPGLDIVSDMKGGILGLLTPSMKSAAHLEAANALRGVLGPMHQTVEKWNSRFEPNWWTFEKLGVKREGLPIDKNPGLKFMSDRSMGRPMTPEMEAINKLFDRMEKELLEDLKNAGADMQALREDYQKGAWTPASRRAFNLAMKTAMNAGTIPRDYDVNKGTPAEMAAIKSLTDQFLAEGKGDDENAVAYLARRPLKGGEGFRRGKVFQEDWLRAVQHGLVSFSNNPVDIEKLLLAEMSRSIMGNRALRKFEAAGDITTEEGLFHPPSSDYVQLKDKYGEMWGGSTVPAWKIIRELAKSGKRDLYLENFSRDVFADPNLRSELEGLKWTMPDGSELNIYGMHNGTGRTYGALIMEKLLENHAKFETENPGIYAKLEQIANNRPRLQQLLNTQEFNDLTERFPVGGRILKGYRYAKRPVADVLNNYLSSSLYNSPAFGTLYKGWMGLASALNQTQLGAGLSAFHASFTAAETQISGVANVLQDIYGLARGNRNVKQLMATMGQAFTALGENPYTGDKVLNAWREPDGVIDPRILQVVKALEVAGAGFTMERGMMTDQYHKAASNFLNGKLVQGAARSPVAAMEIMSHWIMKWLVPRQKAGVFAHMAWRILEQNPGKSMEELKGQINAAWNDVDQRLGQVRYDRIFMNNIAKNVIQGTIRAPGWSGGTIAQLGGAVADTYGFFHEWAKNGKAPDDMPPKVAYTMALLAVTATLCATLTYLFTGEKPHGMDYWSFRTGGTDEHGNPERFVLPTYTKDIIAYSQDPGGTLIDKAHPILSVIGDLYRNKDYYGVQITQADDTKLKKLLDRGKYVAKAFEPFWSRGMRREHERGGGVGRMLMPMGGIMPAPKKMLETAAERLASEYAAEAQDVGGRTQEQAEKAKARAKIVEQMRRRETPDLDSALTSGVLKPSDLPGLRERASMTPLQYQVKKLPLDKAESVYRVATPKEKEQLETIMATKRKNAVSALTRGTGSTAGHSSTFFRGF